MRTGNSILAVFFWFLSLATPISILAISKIDKLEPLREFIPITPLILALIFFVTFVALGCIAGAFGIERKKQIMEEKKDDRFDEILY